MVGASCNLIMGGKYLALARVDEADPKKDRVYSLINMSDMGVTFQTTSKVAFNSKIADIGRQMEIDRIDSERSAVDSILSES